LGGGALPADQQLEGDVARIAEAVREVVDARAAMISRVVDDDWLEVMSVVGEASEGIQVGLRWRRSDLDLLLAHAEEVGRLRLTRHRALSYAEVPVSTPETERYVTGHLGLLIAPLHAPDEELLGVLATEGPVDTAHPSPGTCELVELYAEQARLALSALRDQGVLTERLRLSNAAQGVLQDAAAAEDVPGLLEAVAAGLGEMMRAPGAWACSELEPDVPADAASYPLEIAERWGPDVCRLIEPLVTQCLRDGTTLTAEAAPLLGRLAAVTGHDQILLASIGDGTGTGSRGALLVLRHADDDPWSEDDRDALLGLGRRLGTIVDQVQSRQRDHATVEQLLRLDAYRRDLVASLTHDLKTPLTAITLNTELLESDKRLAEAGSHPVAAIRRSADRLANLVDDLLAMARTEEGADTRSEVDLVTMVRDACDHAETEAALRRVTFDLQAPEELRVVVDQQALARVFANLVANAVKFSLPRGRVGLRLERTGEVVEFRCSDEGIGIPEDRLATLFDFGRRSPDSRTEELPGSGIGLAICHRIVSRLGGEITVESTQGQGSTFSVRIPT
jgi:two-component system, OmpR family, phosphate regulon sensor histidine kinase PhoR